MTVKELITNLFSFFIVINYCNAQLIFADYATGYILIDTNISKSVKLDIKHNNGRMQYKYSPTIVWKMDSLYIEDTTDFPIQSKWPQYIKCVNNNFKYEFLSYNETKKFDSKGNILFLESYNIKSFKSFIYYDENNILLKDSFYFPSSINLKDSTINPAKWETIYTWLLLNYNKKYIGSFGFTPPKNIPLKKLNFKMIKDSVYFKTQVYYANNKVTKIETSEWSKDKFALYERQLFYYSNEGVLTKSTYINAMSYRQKINTITKYSYLK